MRQTAYKTKWYTEENRTQPYWDITEGFYVKYSLKVTDLWAFHVSVHKLDFGTDHFRCVYLTFVLKVRSLTLRDNHVPHPDSSAIQ